jgi:tetratricopeptide (TPR) repeat protein
MLAFAVLVQLAPAAFGSPQMDPLAKEHLDRGLHLYDAQKYAEAIAEFQAGYEIDPQPDFLYAMGQAERLNGDCRRAVAAFEAFLRSGPNSKQEASAKEKLAWCKEELRRHPGTPPTPTPAPLPPAPENPPAPAPSVVAAPPPPPPPPPVVRHRPWAWIAAGGAAALLAGGTVVGLRAR